MSCSRKKRDCPRFCVKRCNDIVDHFRVCALEQPQPTRRARIDASMIGVPTDFRHTGHIGSGDLASTKAVCVDSMQTQMSSKGGYSHVSPVDVHLDVVDLPNHNSS